MVAKASLEFMCPHCGHINAMASPEIKDMYKETLTQCANCNQPMEVIPAFGFGDEINLIVTQAPDTDSR